VSDSPGGDPVSSAYRDVGLRPHAGVGTQDATMASGSLDSRARNALVLGVLSLVLGVFTGAPAIWLGRKALIHIKDCEGELTGRWAAWAAIGLGLLGTAIWLVVLIYFR
jgi:hypothetical protein